MCWARAQSLPSAAGPALGKRDMLPSATFCRRPALGNAWVCRVADVCRVLVAWHSANHVFAECPCLSSRQRPRHSANLGFPVVIVHLSCSFYLAVQCSSHAWKKKENDNVVPPAWVLLRKENLQNCFFSNMMESCPSLY